MNKNYITKIVASGILVSLVSFPLSPFIEAAEVNGNNNVQSSKNEQSEEPNQNSFEYNVPVHEVQTYEEFVNSDDPSVAINPNNLTQEQLQKLGFSQAEAEELHPSTSFRADSSKNWSRKFTTAQISGVVGIGGGAASVAQGLTKLLGGPVTTVSTGLATVIVGVLNISGAKGIQVGGVSYIQKRNPRTGAAFPKPRRVYQPTWAKPYF
ncbi:hypothetical protein K2V61_13110 [Staphylococcus simulans]|uniref:hypothetical protein n=1 Tax=Staphylococcus simulans TaxID=1286 RepID=UPI001E355781|nr:hypothetical protein [Staphylococcus simulans]MCD8916467.1 hypothetical protein [Staphylococcus simulans]